MWLYCTVFSTISLYLTKLYVTQSFAKASSVTYSEIRQIFSNSTEAAVSTVKYTVIYTYTYCIKHSIQASCSHHLSAFTMQLIHLFTLTCKFGLKGQSHEEFWKLLSTLDPQNQPSFYCTVYIFVSGAVKALNQIRKWLSRRKNQ